MPSLLSPTSAHPPSRSYTPLADEVNPPFGQLAPAPIVTRNGTIVYPKRVPSVGSSVSGGSDGPRLKSESEETLSPGRVNNRKGKSREIQHEADDDGDIGQIRREPFSGKGKEKAWDVEEGVEHLEYPPPNAAEEEERRVQDNLAKFAARDMARRRAARLSRQLPEQKPRRPFSLLSAFSGSDRGVRPESTSWPDVEAAPYNNPYDVQPTFSPSRKMVVSPDIASPFAELAPTASPVNSPSETEGFTYGGPSWRGGAAAIDRPAASRGGDKWWHALCAWGSDLDGGYDGDGQDDGRQAGRTNPFE